MNHLSKAAAAVTFPHQMALIQEQFDINYQFANNALELSSHDQWHRLYCDGKHKKLTKAIRAYILDAGADIPVKELNSCVTLLQQLRLERAYAAVLKDYELAQSVAFPPDVDR